MQSFFKYIFINAYVTTKLMIDISEVKMIGYTNLAFFAKSVVLIVSSAFNR